MYCFGILNRLKKKYIHKQKEVSNDYYIIGIKECLPFFVIWITGVAASLIVFCIEKIYKIIFLYLNNHRKVRKKCIIHFKNENSQRIKLKRRPHSADTPMVTEGGYDNSEKQAANSAPIINLRENVINIRIC